MPIWPPTRPSGSTSTGIAWPLIRIGDDVYAIGDECSHADYSLAEGEIDADDKTIECWKHGSAFSVETGEPTSMPAIKPVPVYTVSVEDGVIHVEVSS